MSHLSERPADSVVGQSLQHESAALHVTGEALYTDDLVGRTVGILHAWPVQAPHAHALVTALDPAPAYDVDGVVRVLTAADVPGVNDAGIKHDEPLFPSEVMFHGHAVCWVLGETLEAARLGAAAVAVSYQPLPSLLTAHEAIAAASFQGAHKQLDRGDADSGFAASQHVFEGEFEFAGQEHFYLETHCSLAQVDEGGQVFVQSSTQHPTETQEIVAHVLGLASHEVTVQCLRMGGAFGGKEMQPHGYAAIAALGATLTGRPVRLRLNRTQDMTMSGKRHGFHARWKVGFDADGMLQALDAHAVRRRRVEPRPLRAGARAGALPHRQRVLDPERPARGTGRQDQQDVADRVPRVRRAAGHARHRGPAGQVRSPARHRRRRAAAPQLLPVRPGHAVRHAGAARGADRDRVAAGAGRRRLRGAQPSRSPRSTPGTTT